MQRKEAPQAAQRQVEIEAERRRREAAEAVRRQAEFDAVRRRKDEMERSAAAEEEATRKAAAESEARRAEDERRIASREEATPADEVARLKAEAAVKSAAGREALTRSLQTALNRVGCYRGKIDGLWGTEARAALAPFAKLTKQELATDEPSMNVLQAVVARNGRVCPLECYDGQVVSDGKCVPRPRVAKVPSPSSPSDKADRRLANEKSADRAETTPRSKGPASSSDRPGRGGTCSGWMFYNSSCTDNAAESQSHSPCSGAQEPFPDVASVEAFATSST